MWKRKSFDTRHHQICQNWVLPDWKKIKGTNHKDNIKMLADGPHKAQHILYQNQVFPGQLKKLFEINYTSLSEWVKSDLIDILNNKELDYFFKRHCFK
jgi:hypothetical protein